MSRPRILAFAGSLRRGSFNKKLVKIAVVGARAAGAEVNELDLKDHPLPLYDGDIEATDGLPANARALKEILSHHDGFLISCPEYNTSITGVLKNTIDWVSRREGDEKPLAAFDGKIACLMAASPGRLGGLRGLIHVRAILSNLRVLVLPGEIAVPKAVEAFNDNGRLRDESLQKRIENLGANLAVTIARLKDHET